MRTFICLFIIMSLAGFAMADWDPTDGHKMHYPQLPDPTGWDVNATFPNVLADDWQCSQTGWIWDIHFWGSWLGDVFGSITLFHLSVHADIPAGTGEPPIDYSRPGNLLWEHDFSSDDFEVRIAGEGLQGWYNPNPFQVIPDNHCVYLQYNFFLPTEDRIPQVGGTIYWLDVSATVAPPGTWGWKTSMSPHFMDNAVWAMGFDDPSWVTLYYPPNFPESIDLAFVINGDTTLPVELSLFTAQYLNNVPTLYWVTQSEIDNIGWYVYGNTENDFTTAHKISDLIAGHGTTSEPHSYIYEDKMLEPIPGDVYWYWIESVDLGGEISHFNSINIEISDGSSQPPSITKPVIYGIQNSPNPFRGSTEIKFTLSETALAEVTIFNILGEKIKTLPVVLATEDVEASAYWNGRDESGEKVAHGIYFYTLKAGKSTYSGKIINLR